MKENKISILFYIFNLHGGGAEKILVQLLNHLDRDKYDIRLLAFVKNGVYVDDIPKDIEVKYLFKDSDKINNKFLRLVYRIYRKILVAIILKFSFVLFPLSIVRDIDIEISFIQSLTSIPFLKSKKISWIHTDLNRIDYSDNYRSLVDKNHKKYDSIVAISDSVKKSITERNISLLAKTRLIYNPIFINNINDLANEPIEDIRRNKNLKLFISVGRLEEVKGYKRLLDAFNKVIKEGNKFELWLVGEGPDRKYLEKFVRDNNLIDNVKFLGFKANPYKYVKQADCFISSSYAEGFSLVIAEAMTLGTPVVATETIGACELSNNGKYCTIVSNNVSGLIKGLISDISHKETSNYIKKFGSSHFMNNVDSMFSNLIKY